jgi:amino acid adenylation domain-containing protein
MKDIKEIIRDLRKSNVRLSLNGDNIQIDAMGGRLDDELLSEIRVNKDRIVNYLKKNLTNTGFSHIPVVPQAPYYQLSSAQRRLWILSQFEEGNIAYNIPGVYVFEGVLNKDALVASFHLLIERHEILHTVFREDAAGEVRQFILPSAGFDISFTDLRGEKEQEEIVRNAVQESATAPFDLSNGPLLRAGLYQLADNKWLFTYTLHHIVSDGWSMGILINELLHFYNGDGHLLKPLKIQYKDYAAWQQEQLSGEGLKDHKKYWLQQFAGELPVLEMPADRVRPAVNTYNGGSVRSVINKELSNKIKAICQEQSATLFMGLLAAVNILLYRYTGQEDIIIGSPVAGRDHKDLEDQIGFYINTLALRTQFTGDDSYRALLDNVRRITLGAYEHQVFPFDELVDSLSLQRDMSRNPLFDVSVTLQNAAPVKKQQLGELIVSGYEGAENLVSKFDLSFAFAEAGEELVLGIEYNTDIYNHSTVEQLANHLTGLLGAVILHADAPIGTLEFMSVPEKQRIVEGFNNTATDYPTDKTIAALFEEQAHKTPDNIAVVFENVALTYKQLDDYSNRLAFYLQQEYHTGVDDLVGIMVERSERLIIAILGILKAGAAYVPIDTSYPNGRKEFIINDTGIKVLITETEYLFDLSYFSGEIFAIDVQLDTLPTGSVVVNAGADELSYVMYTSGSTGQPKGVMVNNRSVVRLVKNTRFVSLTGNEVLLSTGAVSFDATTFEYWSMLLHGGKLVLSSKEVLLDASRLVGVMQQHGVDMMWFTAGWLNELVDKDITVFGGLKTLLAGGDKLSPVHIQRLLTHYPSLKIINGYGPTENTTFSLTYPIGIVSDSIPIGTPISNSTAYILDDQQQLCPIGVTGEICVGGAGLARGYLNQPALTAEKFIAHPFEENTRLYKTGDLGRWLPDGNIAFIGRKDDQVKIRGYRIELGEIESQLQQHEDIDAAVVIARSIQEEKELVAYIVSKVALNVDELRTYLSNTLPDYMIPGHYVQLEKLPLNANGKVDRKQLPDPEGFGMNTGITYIPARTETEEQLISIWQEILGKERIGVKDDFFDQGGHSLKAARLASRIHKVFDVKVELKDLFAYTILEDQAAIIASAGKNTFVNIPTAAIQNGYVLSSSQRRLWVLSQFGEGSIAYHVPGVYVFEGTLDVTKLEAAFNALITRHENLRTIFKEDEEGEIKQFILSPEETGFSISFNDLRNEDVVKEQVGLFAGTPFDLKSGPLLRAGLWQIGDNKWVFMYVLHHIISDGWSMNVLIKELLHYYNNEPDQLSPLRIQYKDYAVWQQEQLNGGGLQDHKKYWLQQFEGELPILELPSDKTRPVVRTYNGGIIHQRIDPKISEGLKTLSNEQEGTLFMGLVTAVNALLYRYTGQEDIILGTAVAGREHADLEDQIGFYVNTLALRTRFSGTDTYTDLLSKVKEVTLDAYKYQVYPFDELIDQLGQDRDLSRNALFDVMVVLQNNETGSTSQRLNNLTVTAYEGTTSLTSKFDLMFTFFESGEELLLSIQYNSDIYSADTAERIGIHLERLMSVMVTHPLHPVNKTDYLSNAEKKLLRRTFNDTTTDYPRDKTIADLFEEQAEKTPANIAVVFEDTVLTYQQLNEVSTQFAHYLQQQYHIRTDDFVGIKLERSEWLIPVILGILKTGGAYVPVDPEYPQDRIDYMIKDSRCKVLIDTAELEKFKALREAFPCDNVSRNNTATDLAYVMYTSGSTGQPKGVMVTHRSVVRLVKNTRFVSFTGEEVLLSTGAVSFDATTFEYWGMLLHGGKLVLCSKHILLDETELGALIQKEGVDMMWFTAGWLHELVDKDFTVFKGLKTLLAGGDKLSPSHINRLQAYYPSLKIINGYGPTENTTFSLTYAITPASDLIPVGKPISNSTAYILDAQQQLCPVGVTGEICVGGDGLARGYLNQPDLTAEKFVAHPSEPGARIYKTGDLGRWLPDGNIAFMGRKDDQVKIRGYRIEPGEIESKLQQYKDIDDVVVIARNVQEDKELIAYIVSKTTLHVTDLKSYLGKILPVYMIPHHFIQLEQLPLTPNGKVDRRHLPDPEGTDMEREDNYVAPRNETEEQITRIWKEILGREVIGVKDNFFESGGHSLKATRVARLMSKQFDVNLPPLILFTYSTIEAVAAEIEKIHLVNNEIFEIEDAEKFSI